MSSISVINKTKIILPQAYVTIARLCLSGLDALVLLFPRFLIIWLYNLSMLRVHNEGYSINASLALNLISTFLLWLEHASFFDGLETIPYEF